MSAALDKAEWHVMAHATAWDSKDRLYRNHYCARPGEDHWGTIQALCARGLMRVSREPAPLSGDVTVFLVTRAGIAALEGGS
jgi:hypothetical protein